MQIPVANFPFLNLAMFFHSCRLGYKTLLWSALQLILCNTVDAGFVRQSSNLDEYIEKLRRSMYCMVLDNQFRLQTPGTDVLSDQMVLSAGDAVRCCILSPNDSLPLHKWSLMAHLSRHLSFGEAHQILIVLSCSASPPRFDQAEQYLLFRIVGFNHTVVQTYLHTRYSFTDYDYHFILRKKKHAQICITHEISIYSGISVQLTGTKRNNGKE